jgi:hypothetical protein
MCDIVYSSQQAGGGPGQREATGNNIWAHIGLNDVHFAVYVFVYPAAATSQYNLQSGGRMMANKTNSGVKCCLAGSSLYGESRRH